MKIPRLDGSSDLDSKKKKTTQRGSTLPRTRERRKKCWRNVRQPRVSRWIDVFYRVYSFTMLHFHFYILHEFHYCIRSDREINLLSIERDGDTSNNFPTFIIIIRRVAEGSSSTRGTTLFVRCPGK